MDTNTKASVIIAASTFGIIAVLAITAWLVGMFDSE